MKSWNVTHLLFSMKMNISHLITQKNGLDPKQINDAEVQPCCNNIPVDHSPTNSYGLESKKTDRSPAMPTVETKLIPLQSNLPCLPCFESKLSKTNTANRFFVSFEKELELQYDKHDVEYLSPTLGKLPKSTYARRRKLKCKCYLLCEAELKKKDQVRLKKKI